MKKIMMGALLSSLLLSLVAWGRWDQLFHVKIMILFIMGLIASYYQADYHPFKINNEKVDKGTVLHIIWTVYLSQVFSLLEALKWNYPQSLSFSFWSYLFILFSLFGLWLRSWAYLTLGQFFTMHLETKADHVLIETGPYKYLRHPSYTGAFLTYLFNPLFLQAYYTAVISSVFLFWAFYRRILLEEKMLQQKLGDDYKVFCKTRYRLIPGIW